MNTKALIPLVAGLGLAGLAAKLGFDYVQRAKGAQPQMVAIWTAAQDIPSGSPVEEVALAQQPFPAQLVPQGAILEKDKIVGRVTRGVIPTGVPMVESLLLAPGARAGLHVKTGFRAVAVKIDESSGVDNHLQPGAFVDVVGFFTIRGKQGNETIARTLIENVEVAAVGQRISPTPGADSSGAAKSGKSSSSATDKPARAVVLFVKPETVPLLHLAEQRGALKLSMRGSDDGAAPAVASAAEAELLGTKPSEPEKPKTDENALEKIMAAWMKNQPAQPQPQPPQAEAPKPAPKPAWVTTVWNGQTKDVFNWKSLDSMETLTPEALAPLTQRPPQPAPRSTLPPLPLRGGMLSAPSSTGANTNTLSTPDSAAPPQPPQAEPPLESEAQPG